MDPSVATAEPASEPAPSQGPRARGWRAEWLTLLLALLIVYVFAASTLPALLERHDLRERRAETESEIQQLQGQVRVLQDWNAGASTDPQLKARLLDGQRLSPDAPGYRVLPDPGAKPPAKAGAKG